VREGIVKGKLQNKGWGAELGYNGFKHTNSQDEQTIKTYVLISDELISNWNYLDEFEG
jgi:hypothetical protein